MGTKGQGGVAWRERWQKGTCPVHGRGLFERPSDVGQGGDGYVRVSCPKDECTVVAAQWPGHRDHHSVFGWLNGPDEVKAVLVKASEVEADTPRAGSYARECRTEWPLGEGL